MRVHTHIHTQKLYTYTIIQYSFTEQRRNIEAHIWRIKIGGRIRGRKKERKKAEEGKEEEEENRGEGERNG